MLLQMLQILRRRPGLTLAVKKLSGWENTGCSTVTWPLAAAPWLTLEMPWEGAAAGNR